MLYILSYTLVYSEYTLVYSTFWMYTLPPSQPPARQKESVSDLYFYNFPIHIKFCNGWLILILLKIAPCWYMFQYKNQLLYLYTSYLLCLLKLPKGIKKLTKSRIVYDCLQSWLGNRNIYFLPWEHYTWCYPKAWQPLRTTFLLLFVYLKTCTFKLCKSVPVLYF